MKVWDWAEIELETLGLALYCTVQLDLSQDKLSNLAIQSQARCPSTEKYGKSRDTNLEKVGIIDEKKLR